MNEHLFFQGPELARAAHSGSWLSFGVSNPESKACSHIPLRQAKGWPPGKLALPQLRCFLESQGAWGTPDRVRHSTCSFDYEAGVLIYFSGLVSRLPNLWQSILGCCPVGKGWSHLCECSHLASSSGSTGTCTHVPEPTHHTHTHN